VQLFVKENKIEEGTFDILLNDWEKGSKALKNSMDELFKTLANG
jgi:hypothetical protein